MYASPGGGWKKDGVGWGVIKMENSGWCGRWCCLEKLNKLMIEKRMEGLVIGGQGFVNVEEFDVDVDGV